jgi:xylulokinase
MIFSTQAQGVIPVDADGKALYNNITWIDSRAQKQAEHAMNRFGGKKVFTLVSGTPIMGKDSLAKILWLKEERPDIYEKTDKILDVNGYLTMRCTGEKVAELSGASTYGLDLKKKDWFSVYPRMGIDMDRLARLVKATDNVGGLLPEAAEACGLAEGTPIFGGCFDVPAAAVGSGMTGEGDIHVYLGTSGWVCASSAVQDKFKRDAAALESADHAMNLIVGEMEAAGANIQWIKDSFFKHESEIYGDGIYDYMDSIIDDVAPGSDHLVFTPWIEGERCPVSTTTTRATMFNLTSVHTREHMMRAVYEGIAYNLRWIFENMKQDYGFDGNHFRIIGGGALDKGWMQIIADVTGLEFSVTHDPRNAGAVGAAIIAMVGLGYLKDFSEAKRFVKTEATYTPNPASKKVYDKLFEDYKRIYYSLEKAYKLANGARFSESEE